MVDGYSLLGNHTALSNTHNTDDTMLHSPNYPDSRVRSPIRPHPPGLFSDYVAQITRDMDPSHRILYQYIIAGSKKKHRTVPSPMSDAPDDILMEIFWWAAYETMVDDSGRLTPPPTPADHVDSLDPLGARWVIPQVCRRWNVVSRAYLDMWQHIYLTAPAEDMVLSPDSKDDESSQEFRRYVRKWRARLDLLLARSQTAEHHGHKSQAAGKTENEELDLFVDIRTDTSEYTDRSKDLFQYVVLGCIENRSKRWKSLCIAAQSYNIERLSPIFPRLTTLKIFFVEGSRADVDAVTIFNNAMQLETVISPPLFRNEVRYLSMFCQYHRSFRTSHRELSLHSMPNLEHLYLFNLSHDTLPEIEGEHLQLSMLKTLLLVESDQVVHRKVNDILSPTDQQVAASPIDSFMNYVSTPSVQHLLLDFGAPGNVNTMPALSEPLSRVTRLTIKGRSLWKYPSTESRHRVPLYRFLEMVWGVNALELNENVAQQVLDTLKIRNLTRLRKVIVPDAEGGYTELLNEINRMRGKLAIKYQDV